MKALTRSPYGPRIGVPLRPAPRDKRVVKSEPPWSWRLIVACWVVGQLAAAAAAWLMLVEKW
jgi:hypothetical protein